MIIIYKGQGVNAAILSASAFSPGESRGKDLASIGAEIRFFALLRMTKG
jgi:hypothetical protein